MKRKIKGYLFNLLNDGSYEITHEADINIFNINRIFEKVKVKGRRVDFELVELRGRDYGPIKVLVKRSDINFEVMCHFVTTYYNGDRSVQHRPYTADLFDNDILEDLNMCVLTYKYYYSGERFLADVYYPCRLYTPYNEVNSLLTRRTEEALQEQKRHEESINKNKEHFDWKEISHGNKDKK